MLSELDDWLGKKNLRVTLHVIGGYALELKAIQRGFQTEDIDSVFKITNQEILEQIQIIGESFKNPHWFDFSAPSLIVPEGYQDRLERIDKFENIELYVLSKCDLIKMKVAAYHSRRDRGIYRDLEDLKNLQPTQKDISEAIIFYRTQYSRDLTGKFKDQFILETQELEKELLEVLL